MAAWYINFGNGTSTGYYAVEQWAAVTAYNVGDLRRQLAAPAVGSERVFRCTTAGASGATEPTWTLTKASTTNDATAVWTEVTGNSTYNWSAPHARLASAYSWGAAGDIFYVSHAHAETQASALTLTSPGTNANPCRVICVNSAGSVPPVSADLAVTATITTTGNSPITLAGAGFVRGITYSCGTGAVTASIIVQNSLNLNYFKNCSFRKLGTTATAVAIYLNGATVYEHILTLDNCTMQFGNVGDSIATSYGNAVLWKNTPNAIVGSIFPTALFTPTLTSLVKVVNVDLSALGSGKSLNRAAGVAARFFYERCKLGSSVTISDAQPLGGAEICATACDSSGTNYRNEKYNSAGTQVTETTIVRTGGFSIKGTPISVKLVTTSGASWPFPFEAIPIVIPDNDTIGTPITVTVQGIWGGGAVPLNDEIWMDVEYFGDTASPQGSFVSSGKADILATGANLTAGSGTWGGSTTKFAMSVTFTPQLKGPIYIYPKAAKASSTFYIDPLPIVT